MKHTPYIIASAFATFILLASVALYESSYFDFLSSVEFLSSTFTVVTVLSILSVLVVMLSYKIISNNKEIEARKNKFAQKRLELEKELILEQKAKETANNQVEELRNQLQQKNKEILDDKCKNISEVTKEKEKLEVELKSQEEKIQKLSTLKNKELNDKDSEIRELKNQLVYLKDFLMEECRIMEQKIAEKDAYLAKLDYNLNQIKCKEEHSLSSPYVQKLQKKMLNQIEESFKKQKVIEEMNNQIEELTEKVNLLTRKNNTLSDKMTTYSSKNEELVTFINETLSNIEREKEDLESLYSSERKQKGFLALETIENCLENFKELYSKTKDRAEKLSILVQRKGELSSPLASPACRSLIQGH
ncbi:hypothetical protein HCR18_02250 [Wolbachia pipientis]|uniref:hypothetical protein n=1 Tax=Wolbachia pipientis TaxID=955 RepID=UPI0015F8503F|nr:hypothetical protein [Wolbachia pipientis]MBA8757901.1 hypothetical protein [Wolbachia pipientis]